MTFRDYAANETSALIRRLLTKRTEKPRAELSALRAALDQAVQALETALANSVPEDHEADITALATRLTAAASAQAHAAGGRAKAEAQTSIDRLQAELDRISGEHASLTASLADSRAQVEALQVDVQSEKDRSGAARAELTSVTKRLEEESAGRTAADAELILVTKRLEEEASGRAAADAQLAQLTKRLDVEATRHSAADAEVARLTTELESEVAERSLAAANVARLTSQLEAEVAQRTSAMADAARLRAELEAGAAERSTAASELAHASKQIEAATADGARLVAALNMAQQQLRAGQAEREALASQLEESAARIGALENAIAERERADEGVQVRLAASMEAEAALGERVAQAEQDAARASSRSDRLLTVFRDLAGATAMPDALAIVANGLTGDFSRVALFSVKGNRLEGMYQTGFEFGSDISKVVVPLTLDSLLAETVSADRVEGFMARDLADSSRLPFGGEPTCVIAVPVSVNGETLGVIYADNAGEAQTEVVSIDQQVKFAELLRYYAVAYIERLTTTLKALAELRAYAKLLLDEVEHMYTADTDAGKKGPELHTRMQENLQCARQIFAQRVELEGPAAAPLLEELIASIVQAKPATPFGRDLAALARIATGPRRASSRTAQAS